MISSTYEEVRRAITDERNGSSQQGPLLPAWMQLFIAVAAILVSVTLAYSALDKRISLIEQKLDYVVQQVKTAR